jgi:mRNA interferase YafQ
VDGQEPATKAEKRATLPRASEYDKQFLKDRKSLTRLGRDNTAQPKEVMMLLVASDGSLPPEWDDHMLQGQWADHRECHVGGDFLLIYQIDGTGDGSVVTFVRTGPHSELFD